VSEQLREWAGAHVLSGSFWTVAGVLLTAIFTGVMAVIAYRSYRTQIRDPYHGLAFDSLDPGYDNPAKPLSAAFRITFVNATDIPLRFWLESFDCEVMGNRPAGPSRSVGRSGVIGPHQYQTFAHEPVSIRETEGPTRASYAIAYGPANKRRPLFRSRRTIEYERPNYWRMQDNAVDERIKRSWWSSLRHAPT
jgi:hypothetical protein